MEKRIIQFLFACAMIFVIWNFWQPLWKQNLKQAVDPKSEEKITFEITKGSGAQVVANNLKKADLIKSKKAFLRAVKKDSLDTALRYGKFRLSQSMTGNEIITILTSKGTGEMVLTILEGWRIKDMDDYLFEMGLIKDGDFELCIKFCEFEYDFLEDASSLEGYLFPDTYFVDSSGFSVETFINQMLSNFSGKMNETLQNEIESSGRTLDEIIIVASMIEKEVRTEKDIPIVGGIIWKRLDNDWTLGIDATSLYLKDDNTLSASDLNADSPYNTRKLQGLPPTAISSPGLESILGAIYPEESPYWFYLTTLDTGEVIYSKDNAEHEKNKDLHL